MGEEVELVKELPVMKSSGKLSKCGVKEEQRTLEVGQGDQERKVVERHISLLSALSHAILHCI